MKEDFLHYLWKFKKFNFKNPITTDNQEVEIISVGQHNKNSGPDFFNAKIRVGNQLWAGNVEIHIKSSDWYLHSHEMDSNYDNVILHVVWEDDYEIYRKDNTSIPTFRLKDYVSKDIIGKYSNLLTRSTKWINCENQLDAVDEFTIHKWLERLYIERLEHKSNLIFQLLESSNNDWEAVLYKMLLKNFGLKVNGDSFLSLASSIDFKVIRKVKSNHMSLEALLFGQANLLDQELEDSFYNTLKGEYSFLKKKFNLSSEGVLPIQFFRLRPSNFPSIRISQFSSLYYGFHNLFQEIIEIKSLENYYELFSIEASEYWQTHYVFDKTSRKSKKQLSKSFIDLLIINTIVPIKFAYFKHLGKSFEKELIDIIEQVKSEKNSVIERFTSLGITSKSAKDSQALIQLKNSYCNLNKCLQCQIGNSLLNRT